MSGDIKQFLNNQRWEILKEKERLNFLERLMVEEDEQENKENLLNNQEIDVKRIQNEVPSVVEPLDLTGCYDVTLDRKKRFLNPFALDNHRLADESTTDSFGRLCRGALYEPLLPTLRRGVYAPPPGVRATPHAGLGEYDVVGGHRTDRTFLTTRRSTSNCSIGSGTSPKTESKKFDSKSVQTDIQNIHNELVVKNHHASDKVTPPRSATDALVDAALLRNRHAYVDQRLTTAQNDFLSSSVGKMDNKPKSILSNRRTGTAAGGTRYTNASSDYGTSNFASSSSFLDGFSYTDRSDELDRERIKRETYQQELRLQIEEKRHLAALRDEQERRERDLENRRLEQQLMRMREEEMQEDQRRQRRTELMRRHSDDLLRRKTELHELQRPWRRHADSESANLDSYGLGPAASYSPPVTRRAYSSSSYNIVPCATSVFLPPTESSSSNRYNPRYYETTSSYPADSSRSMLRKSYDTVPLPRGNLKKFDRFDSLSRIDSLSHRLETMSVRGDETSSTSRHSPRMRRRNSSARFEDYSSQLPVPMLKARFPVAKELRNAIPFSSESSSRRWSKLDSPARSGSSILTQLSSIRAQLQREQLRMDESLRRGGLRATEDY